MNRIASSKPKLDKVLLCIPSQFGLVKFGWELSGLVWFDIIWCGMDEFGVVESGFSMIMIMRAQAQLSSLVYELVLD